MPKTGQKTIFFIYIYISIFFLFWTKPMGQIRTKNAFFYFCVHYFSFWTIKTKLKIEQILPKMVQKHIFNIFCPFCFILNKKKEKQIKILKIWAKNGPKMDPKWTKNAFFILICQFFSFWKKKTIKKKTKIWKFWKFWPKNGLKMGQNGQKNVQNSK